MKLYEIGSATKIWFTFLSLKIFRHEERETQSFYADCFYIVSSQPNQRVALVAHKFVWPRPALKVKLLLPRGNSTHCFFSNLRHEESETQSFYAECFYIVSSQPNQRAAPVAHKFVWPRPALKVKLLLPRRELNSLFFLKSQTWGERDTQSFYAECFYIVSSQPKQKSKIYKTKSLGYYITYIAVKKNIKTKTWWFLYSNIYLKS